MIINKIIGIRKNTLSSVYVPVSYWNIITPYQRRKSIEVVIYDKYKDIIGVGRNLYISSNLREISDIWISPEYRGKTYKSKKYSHYLIEKLIEYDNINNYQIIINLEVHRENIKAINLYKNHGFYTNKSSNFRNDWLKSLGLKKTITMSKII